LCFNFRLLPPSLRPFRVFKPSTWVPLCACLCTPWCCSCPPTLPPSGTTHAGWSSLGSSWPLVSSPPYTGRSSLPQSKNPPFPPSSSSSSLSSSSLLCLLSFPCHFFFLFTVRSACSSGVWLSSTSWWALLPGSTFPSFLSECSSVSLLSHLFPLSPFRPRSSPQLFVLLFCFACADTFDYFFSSHQFWHVLVALATVWWYFFCLDLAFHRMETPCHQ